MDDRKTTAEKIEKRLQARQNPKPAFWKKAAKNACILLIEALEFVFVFWCGQLCSFPISSSCGQVLADIHREISGITYISQEKSLIENNMDIVGDLRPEHWEGLDVEERLRVLQNIVNLEKTNLGLSYVIRIKAVDSVPEELACYYDPDHQICINRCYLESDSIYDSYVMLRVVLHEAYHSYQCRLADLALGTRDEKIKNLLIFRQGQKYYTEFMNYHDGLHEDDEAYAAQQCEQDANAYATSRAQEYMQCLKMVDGNLFK